MTSTDEFKVRVVAIEVVAANIKRFRLEPIDAELPSFSAGSHVVISMNADDRKIRNPYSLMGADDPATYEITVLKTINSRGGSHYMHDHVTVGSELTISAPVNLFPVNLVGRKHILIAGGIGITPFIPMMHQISATQGAFQLHYAMRNQASGAYAQALQQKYPGRVFLYRDNLKEKIPLSALLRNQPLGTHLYVCGPEGMINWALNAGEEAGWPKESLHAERFLAPPSGAPFSVKLLDSKLKVRVHEYESILEAVEAAGVEAQYLCRGGACGQCETAVVSYDGELVHNDNYLSPEEKSSGKKIMICVSRLKGRELSLKL